MTLILIGSVVERGDVFLRDDDDVDGRRRIDVVEGEDLVGLLHLCIVFVW